MRTTALATAIALLLSAAPALAQAPISTAPETGPANPQPTAPAPPLSSAEDDAGPPQQQTAMGPCGPEKVKADGTLETKPHGEVEVGVGTGGFRHVAGAVCQPIGQTGAIAVSISQTQGGGYGARRR